VSFQQNIGGAPNVDFSDHGAPGGLRSLAPHGLEKLPRCSHAVTAINTSGNAMLPNLAANVSRR